jgi:hypothetical protein
VLAFASTCPAPPKPFTALNMPISNCEHWIMQITPTRHKLTRTQEAHECHHNELHLRGGIVRQFERANLRMPVPPTIGYLDRLLSLVCRLRLGRSYMVFWCRLLRDAVHCGSFCVRHSVSRVLMPDERSERACGLATAIAEVGLGVVRCAIRRWVGLRGSKVMFRVHQRGHYSSSRLCKNGVSSERLKRDMYD